jgi:hypothetical protein
MRQTTISIPGGFVGTPEFASPEQFAEVRRRHPLGFLYTLSSTTTTDGFSHVCSANHEATDKGRVSPTTRLAYQRSTPFAQRLSDGVVEHTHMFERTVGDQRRRRLDTQHEQKADRMLLPNREAAPAVSWDFGQIPIFSSDRTNQSSTLTASSPTRAIHPKLTVEQASDPLQHEANRIAEAPRIVHDVMRSPGQPLDPPAKAFFELRFGCDLSHVRVHTGERAAESARVEHAAAYTFVNHIVLGPASTTLSFRDRRRLLAHELAHGVQQSRGGTPSSQSALELDAQRASARLVEGRPVHVEGRGVPAVARQGAPLLSISDPKTLSNEELAKEIVLARAWLKSHQVSSVENDRLAADLAVMEAEVQRRVYQERVLEKQQADRPEPSATSGSAIPVAAGVAIAAPALEAGATVTTATGGGAAAGAAEGAGASVGGLSFLGPVAAFLAVFLYSRPTVSGAEERRLLEEASKAQILLAAQRDKVIRGNATQLLIHLARFLGETVGGQPPDHQKDPERDKPHWWTEIKNFIKQIQKYGLSNRQLLRVLREIFSEEQLTAMREALKRVAQAMGEDPPDFPPTAMP